MPSEWDYITILYLHNEVVNTINRLCKYDCDYVKLCYHATVHSLNCIKGNVKVWQLYINILTVLLEYNGLCSW